LYKTILKTGQVYKRFKAKNGKTVTLRSIKWDDLDDALQLANSTVAERQTDPDLGVLLDKTQTRESESDWLANKLVRIESGNEISVVAEVDGRVVGNSEVTRGTFNDEFYHGKLGILLLKEFRDQGIGLEMMNMLVEESRKAGLKTIELEVFATNKRGIRVYEKAGFKQVGKIPKKIFRNGKFTDIVVMAIELL
jgi:RimJ/RimL family protein N-acetyltransferase